MDTGPFFSGTIAVTSPQPTRFIHKGLCVRVGEHAEGAVCYDTELLNMTVGWSGPFLQIDGARYGLIVPPRVAGTIEFSTPAIPGWSQNGRFEDPRPNKPFGPLPEASARYDGLYLHGNRVVIAYRIGETKILESPWLEVIDGVPVITRTFEIPACDDPLAVAVCGGDGSPAIVSSVELTPNQDEPPSSEPLRRSAFPCSLRSTDGAVTVHVPPHRQRLLLKIAVVSPRVADRLKELASRVSPGTPIQPMTQSDVPRWTSILETQGKLGVEEGALAVDTLTIPYENPYKALMFISGHDFVSTGDAAVCTAHGDVWLVSGLDGSLSSLRWKRFATGLFQPLGLKIRNGEIFVVGRDQITRLHDRNGDGEADFYENFNNAGEVSTNGHEYVTCLETDREGNFYYLKGDSGSRTRHDGCLLRVSADGKHLEVFATGLRNANGLGIGPNDEITAAPQEGEWTPASGIFPMRSGGFYGAMQVHHRDKPPTDFDRPICWLPRRVDNSSGGQVWVPDGNWGPLAGQLLHFSYGQSTMMLVLREQVGPTLQGAAVPLPITFLSGAMRGRFHPRDGHLYVSGLRGWVTNSVMDGCFQRVRYTGKRLELPIAMRTYANGLALTFSEPLDRETAENPDLYQIEQWNYRWSAQYGSPELRPSQPNVEGREPLYVESASLLNDGRTVFLEVSALQPVWQISIQCRLPTRAGRAELKSVFGTIHRVPAESMDLTGLSRRRGTGFLSEEQRRSLVSGLIARFEQHRNGTPSVDVTRVRTAAFSVEPGEFPSLHTDPNIPYSATFEGLLRPAEPGEYHFRVEGRGTAKIYMNDQLMVDAVLDDPHRVQPGQGPLQNSAAPANGRDDRSNGFSFGLSGFTRLRIEYQNADPTKASGFRVLWRGAIGIEEVIPPTAFWSPASDAGLESSDRIRQGHELLAEHRCAKCHTIEPQAEDAPSLAGAGSRLNAEWLSRWLLSPTAIRPDARMPQLLGDPKSATAQRRAADITAFLATLRDQEPDATRGEVKGELERSPLATVVARGEQHFEDLGCIACHHFRAADEEDEWNRISLRHVARKFEPARLAEYLMQPHRSDPHSRMPNFRLTAREAVEIAGYLHSRESNWDEELALPQGNAESGRKLVQQLGCANCHNLPAPHDRKGLERPRTQVAGRDNLSRGCLAITANRDDIPRYALGDQQRAAVAFALRNTGQLIRAKSPAEQADRTFRMLRCNACHSRDGQPSVLPVVMAEEGGRGVLPESLPDLTWTGERLRAEWMQHFIAGRIPYRPRPQLRARMPAFPQHAELLAHGITAQHAVRLPLAGADSPNEESRLLEQSAASIGYRLTLKDGGLDCRQCHGIGHQQPIGDDQTRIAPGINFVHARDRLRYDFYHRFVLDPPRYDLNTKMPKLSPDGRSTNVTHIYQGDAVRQFDSIWQYIQTLRGDEP